MHKQEGTHSSVMTDVPIPSVTRSTNGIPASTNQVLPCMRYSETPPLTDAFVNQQPSEHTRRVSGRAAGRDFRRSAPLPRQFGGLQF